LTCQRCGQQDATVHLVELVDGVRTSQWLCSACAGRAAESGGDPTPFDFGENHPESNEEEDAYSLASFLGQVFERKEGDDLPDLPACTSCGYTLDQFRRTNSLGCPDCYQAFRTPLLSILSHLHRHVSHLGKVPGNARSGSSRTGALSRCRVALEKAIAAEDFENAARLRDEIHRLETDPTPDGDPAP
jgi:protein arginine kinase activator